MSAVPSHADVERGVHNLAHRTCGLTLEGRRVELEVARQHERVHELLVVGDTFRPAFLAHLAAFFLGRQHFFLSDHGNGRRTEQQAHNDNDCFFHST